MPDALPPAERLLNLVIALVNTTHRMTKEQIRASVAGYDQAASTDAFERMFERDKETLRDLGIPVVTVSSAAHGDDQGYRIDPDAYALPPMQLSAAELGVLALAAEFWQGQALRADAARALTKLRVVGATPSETDIVAGLAPRLHPAGPALTPLLDAAHDRQAVTFTYRTASTGEVMRRHVEPWRLVASGGGWYLVGHDRDRGAARVFRLSRIDGPVRPEGPPGAFEPPAEVDTRSMVATAQRGERRMAWLAVAPERAGALRARAAQH
ncbi:WYL domain-containing protein, partial [Actinotalea ferrariae]|uniref:helix-turn-helix transcriptional regulator n=1 Tax=Actinotalea ferrariae TaxID=1386098 RepID=UPI001C8B6292